MQFNTNKRASWYFHHPQYRYNCAQAITYHNKESDETIEFMAKKGGGRAPEGLCGALYGGLYILRHTPEAQKKLQEIFFEDIGAIHCREIKSRRLASCKHCIDTADKIVKKIEDLFICTMEE